MISESCPDLTIKAHPAQTGHAKDALARSARISGIDGLRAFAVISVILYHLNPRFLPGGFVGVDIFFVISGYVVCGSLWKDSKNNFLSFISGFYVRRLARIYPALIAMLLVGGALSTLFIPVAYVTTANIPTALAAVFGLSNFALINTHNDYFSKTNDFNPFMHTWSLGVEEQFYLIFPLVLFFLVRFEKRGVKFQYLLAGPPALARELPHCSTQCGKPNTTLARAYFLLPSRFWELAIGAMLYIAHKKGRLLPANASKASILAWLGMVVLFIGNVITNPLYFPFPFALLPVLGAVLCIAAVAKTEHAGFVGSALTLPSVVWIGRISYSLYLWHWLIITMQRWTTGADTLAANLVAVILTFLCATASYYFLEKPGQRYHGFLQERKVWALAIGLAIIGLSYVVLRKGTSLHAQNVFSLSTVVRNRNDWYPHTAFEDVKEDTGPLVRGKTGLHWSDRRLFCVGDSHAGAYGGMLRMLEVEDGVSVVMECVPGICVGSLVLTNNDTGHVFENTVLQDLKTYGRPGDVILLASLRVPRLCQQWPTPPPAPETPAQLSELERDRQIAVTEGKEFIQKLLDMKFKVIVEAPLPVFKSPPFFGSDWYNRRNPMVREGFVMDKQWELDHRTRPMKSITEVKQTFPEVTVWDPLEVYAFGDECRAFEGDKPLFFDGDHLSDYGGRKAYPSFKAVLQEAWN